VIRCWILLIGAVLSLTIPFLRGSTGAGDDAKLLQGRWRVLSMSYNGSNSSSSNERAEKLLVVFEGDEIRVSVAGTDEKHSARFSLDAQTDPKHIDFLEPTRYVGGPMFSRLKLFQAEKKEDGRPADDDDGAVEGIYKLDGDSLTLCWRTRSGADIIDGKVSSETQVRPRAFRSDLYYHQFLFVLERLKPEK
jgi:uncharacterized protein (TIGR03067 family)